MPSQTACRMYLTYIYRRTPANGSHSVSFSHLPRPVWIFTPPALPKSQAAYANEEVRFLWVNIQYFRRSDAQKAQGEVIIHSERQREALLALEQALSSKVFNMSLARNMRQWALESLYFAPDVLWRALKPFGSPLKAYMALLCLSLDHSGRSFAPLHLYPPHLSKLSCSIRLAAFNHLMEIL